MKYIRTFLILSWFCFVFTIAAIASVFRWGDPNLVKDYFRLFSKGALWLCGIKMKIEGIENLEAKTPCVYVANHQSALDVALYGSICPDRMLIIGKKEIIYIPLFGFYFKAAGNILINRQHKSAAHESIELAAKKIKEQKVSIGIFPEGTRNRNGIGLLPFKKGAFHLAMKAGVPIVPMVCSPLSKVMDIQKKDFKGGVITMRILPPMNSTSFTKENIGQVAIETRELMLKHLNELSC